MLFSLLEPTLAVAEFKLVSQEFIKEAKRYRNPEERRDAGLGTQINQWLKFSGLLELETEYQNQTFKNRSNTSRVEIPTLALQLGFELTFTEWLIAELIVETEYDGKRTLIDLDEGYIGIETEQWDFKVGRQYLSFGEYNSYFISGPLLEFGETRGEALIIDFSPFEEIELSAFIFASEVGSRSGNPDLDWGVSFNFASENGWFSFGASYLSDLAESKEQLLDGADYHRRVSAWSAYALFSYYHYEFSAEIVQANSVFAEMNEQTDKPFAYNFELAYFPTPSTQFALRFEHSDELSDQPQWQYGVSATWRPMDSISISLEYLYGQFQPNFAFDDEEDALNERHLAALQLAFEF